MAKTTTSIRARLYRQLEPTAWTERGLSPANRFASVLIVLASIIAILETEETIREPAAGWFLTFELVVVVLFSIEYIARWYAAGENPRYAGFRGRMRYVASGWALIDLLAILPFLFTGGAQSTFFVRLLRLLRFLRLARLGRFSQAWDALAQAVSSRSYELALSGTIAAMLMVFSSAVLYVFEAEHQPEAFGSIPRALWWSVATLTTVGYGDVTPVTVFGRLFAGITAIAGIGLIAMPTGILASAFSEVVQRRRLVGRPSPRTGENGPDPH